jgi:hypothetical protein
LHSATPRLGMRISKAIKEELNKWENLSNKNWKKYKTLK